MDILHFVEQNDYRKIKLLLMYEKNINRLFDDPLNKKDGPCFKKSLLGYANNIQMINFLANEKISFKTYDNMGFNCLIWFTWKYITREEYRLYYYCLCHGASIYLKNKHKNVFIYLDHKIYSINSRYSKEVYIKSKNNLKMAYIKYFLIKTIFSNIIYNF